MISLVIFVSDPSLPNWLIEKYFGKMNKIPKLDFFTKLKNANYFLPKDQFNIGVVYFISTFWKVLEASSVILNFIKFLPTFIPIKRIDLFQHKSIFVSSRHHKTRFWIIYSQVLQRYAQWIFGEKISIKFLLIQK